VEIVRAIGWEESKRLVISCMTRYGKSFCVAIGILIYIFRNHNKRINVISPLISQSKIIRNYLSSFILESDIFSSLVDIAATGLDRLKSEVSKQRITFVNGCELTILSAEGEGTRLMGHGGDLNVIDESCLLNYEVYRSKISRMLGDNSNSIMVEIGNPWHRNNQMWLHWTSPEWDNIHVDYKIALKEGRITKEFVEEQRKLLTKMEFQILYEANFPEDSEDSLFFYKYVKKATESDIQINTTTAKKIISCDVADKGSDKTVIMTGYGYEGYYYVKDIYSEDKSENMQVAGRIVDIHHRFGADIINIDTIGVGVGVVSRVREVLNKYEVIINACHFGEGVGASGMQTRPGISQRIIDRRPESERKRFLNRKSEQYFRLKDLFEEKMISIPEHSDLIKELMAMGQEITSSGKTKIIDPEAGSPDFADALVYFIWQPTTRMILDVG